jgi:hypothetical protein
MERWLYLKKDRISSKNMIKLATKIVKKTAIISSKKIIKTISWNGISWDVKAK